MGVGISLDNLQKKGLLADDILHSVRRLTACAVDARMGGVPRPAMSICGSGDHGLVATIPIIAAAEKMDKPASFLLRSIALSYLVTMYIKEFSGRLSAFCGCAVAAGTGAAAGITFLLGGVEEEVGKAVEIMAANITGMICDGGNFGCALKAVTGAESAVLAALFALDGAAVPSGSGIVGRSVEETLQNMGKIASPGMLETNDVILQIMTSQKDDSQKGDSQKDDS